MTRDPSLEQKGTLTASCKAGHYTRVSDSSRCSTKLLHSDRCTFISPLFSSQLQWYTPIFFSFPASLTGWRKTTTATGTITQALWPTVGVSSVHPSVESTTRIPCDGAYLLILLNYCELLLDRQWGPAILTLRSVDAEGLAGTREPLSTQRRLVRHAVLQFWEEGPHHLAQFWAGKAVFSLRCVTVSPRLDWFI